MYNLNAINRDVERLELREANKKFFKERWKLELRDDSESSFLKDILRENEKLIKRK